MNNDLNLYDVFLSYHWTFHNEIINLHRILTNQGYKVWLDLVEIRFGDHLEERVENAIKLSGTFVCFLSEDYINSKNCELELRFAFEKKKKMYVIFLESTNEMSFNLNKFLASLNEKDIFNNIYMPKFIINNSNTKSNTPSNLNNDDGADHFRYDGNFKVKNKINIEFTASEVSKFLDSNLIKENVTLNFLINYSSLIFYNIILF